MARNPRKPRPRKPRKITFTPEKLAKFRELWDQGWSFAAISPVVGISVSALGSARARYNLAPRIRVANDETVKARKLTKGRALARSGHTLDVLPSLVDMPRFVAQGLARVSTDAKLVSRKSPPDHKCQFPIGEPWEEGFHLCGVDDVHGGPYCDTHKEIAYLSREEAAAVWRAALGRDPKKL